MNTSVQLRLMELYERIKVFRERSGLTQTNVADSLTRAGYTITPQGVQLWESSPENGGTTPRGAGKRNYLADLFGTDYSTLFLNENNPVVSGNLDVDLLKKCLSSVLQASVEIDQPISVATVVDYALELYNDPDDLTKPKKVKRFLEMFYQKST